MTKKIESEIAHLVSVSHDQNTDDVFLTYKVTSSELRELAFRLARRHDIEWLIRGDKVGVVYQEEDV